jgi:type VI secretion system protein ImpA
MDKLGGGQAPDLGALETLLREAQSIMNEQLAKRGVSGTDAETAASAAGAGVETPSMAMKNGEIRSREDAARMMDRIADYFKQHEPSSPVPLLMQRAKRLTSMDFLEILRDVAPEGLKQAKNIGGLGDE